MSAALSLLAVALVAALLPPAGRPVPGRDVLCAVLTVLGAGCLGLALPLVVAGAWGAGPRIALLGVALVLVAMWLAHAPDSDDEGDGGQGGGGSRRRDPDPSSGGPVADGPDWDAFDELRAGWERTPVG